MKSIEATPLYTLVVFGVISTASYVFLLGFLIEYQRLLLPIANGLAVTFQLPAQFNIRSEHLIISVYNMDKIQSFQLDGTSWIYSAQASSAGTFASSITTWQRRICAGLIACTVLTLLHASLLFFAAVEYVQYTLGLFDHLGLIGHIIFKTYVQATPICLCMMWLYISRDALTIILNGLITKKRGFDHMKR